MRLFSTIHSLARNRKNQLFLRDYMLDAPHDALQFLSQSLMAALIESDGGSDGPLDIHGLLALSGVQVIGSEGTRLAVGYAAGIARGLPVVLSHDAIDVGGMWDGTPMNLYLTADPIFSEHEYRDPITKEVLSHEMVTSYGQLRVAPAQPANELEDFGARGVLLATFTAGSPIRDLTVMAPDLRLRGLGAGAALPRSVTPLSLADGEAYILAQPGAAPELRAREGGMEYRLPMELVVEAF